MSVLLFISLIGYFLFIAKVCRWSITAAPLLTICMIPSILYIFGIFNMLVLGANLLFYIGLALFAGYLFICFKEKRIPYEEILHPGMVYFIFYFIFLYFTCQLLSYNIWDEFSHWGLAAKDMFFTNRLVNSESAVAFKSFPPGLALFDYFITSIIGYSEGKVFFAHNLFLISALTMLFQSIRWKQFYSVVLTFLIIYNLIFFFGGFTFQSITPDHIIGVVFSMSIASYFLFQGSDQGRMGHLIPVLFFLPLIKQIGLFLAICVVVIIVSDHFYRFFCAEWRAQESQFVRINSKNRFFSNCKLLFTKNMFLILVLLAVILIAPIVSSISWKGWIENNKIQETFKISFSLDQIKASFSKDKATQRDKETLKNFREAFLKQSIISGAENSFLAKHIKNKKLMSMTSFFLICLIIGLISALLQFSPTDRRRVLICQMLMAVFFVVYCFVHLWLYLYAFGGYEGPRLASFSRYMSIFFLGWGFVSIGFLVAVRKESIWRYRLSRLLLTIILTFLILLASPSNKDFLFGKSKPWALRSEVEQNLPIIERHCPLNSSVYYIWQNETGLRSWIFGYGIYPRKTNSGGHGGPWSLGEPYYEGDVWTADYTPEQLLNVFREYDYIFIGNADEKFWKRYGALFSIDVDLMEYFSGANTRKDNLDNLMRNGTITTIEQGSVAWSGWTVARVNGGVTDAGVGAYGYTVNDAEASNNGRGLTLTFGRSVALTTLVHWSYSNLTFNYVIEYYNGGAWTTIATIACPTTNPAVISFNADQSKSSTQWRWYISHWNNPGTNFYAFELEAYESMQGAYSEYINFIKSGALFKIIKSLNGNISIKKIE